LALSCAAGVLLALPGCQAPNESRAKDYDPLMGGKVPEKTYGVGMTPMPPQNRAGTTPALPGTVASKSNAHMNNPDPLLGGKAPLAIDDQQKQPATVQPAGTWQALPPVQLNKPDQAITPVPPPQFQSQNAPQAQPLPANNTQVSYTDAAQLEAALKQHGVIWQDQKVQADGTHFLFGVANPYDANFSRTYETVAPDYRAAVLALLEQLDHKH
jgi:hypothetical protein